MIRAALSVAATIGVAALFAGQACTSFSGADSPDAGDEAGIDATVAVPPSCTVPSVPYKTGDDSAACNCAAPKLFVGTAFDDAVVVGDTLYARDHSSTNVLSGSITSVLPPTTWASGTPAGASLGMFATDNTLYVATTGGVRGYTRESPGNTSGITPLAPDTTFEHVLFGDSVIYTWAPTRIVEREIADAGVVDQIGSGPTISAAAVDGDKAYITVSDGTGAPDPIATFPMGIPLGSFPEAIKALVAAGGYAFAATVGSSSVISRATLAPAANLATPIITEFGLVQRLDIDGDRLYWVAQRGGDAGVVLASSDFCGDDYRLLATKLPATATGVSFDATSVYVAGNGEELRKIPKTR